ncbi:unnamed protein product [Prorocentrum cordatum]|uniref:Uncharacterized protein n=1 Tax=Prorocentrum cordatum TaxID=2364126 RepID=A0ABN9TE20_9DINO|nr:unnamed protein product [Polarella glacialis]
MPLLAATQEILALIRLADLILVEARLADLILVEAHLAEVILEAEAHLVELLLVETELLRRAEEILVEVLILVQVVNPAEGLEVIHLAELILLAEASMAGAMRAVEVALLWTSDLLGCPKDQRVRLRLHTPLQRGGLAALAEAAHSTPC